MQALKLHEPDAEPLLALPSHGEHLVASRVELLVALARSPSPSRLKKARWEKLLSRFPPQYRRVIILHGLMGWDQVRTAERLAIRRQRVWSIWQEVRGEVSHLIDLEDV